MNSPPEHEEIADRLLDHYRRASAADGNRPSDAVRAAIAAQARTEAAARAARSGKKRVATTVSAANNAHWRSRAAASLAVVAIGALIVFRIFRPVDPALSRADVTTPVAVQAPAAREMAVGATASGARAGAALADNNSAPVASSVAESSDANADRAIIGRYFPDVLGAAATEQLLWVIFDEAGQVLHTGRHALAAETQLRAFMEGEFPGVKIRAYRVTTLSAVDGRPVRVAFAWAAAHAAATVP